MLNDSEIIAAKEEDDLISIVMAVYNGQAYLEPQIRSILGQSYQNMELIISDDASSDGSLRIAEEFSLKDSRIKILKSATNLGIKKNFLKALALTRGELICFADQDDVWRIDKLNILAGKIAEDAGIMLAYSDLQICDESLKVTHKSFWKAAQIQPRSGRVRELALLRNIMPGCSMMFRREVRDLLIAVPGESSLMHDHLAFIVASSLGKIAYSKKALVKYRQHQHNNIGAFYPSVSDRARFQEQLGREVRLLQPFLRVEQKNLECFLSEKAHKSIFSRWKFIRYYLFLRPDTLISKGLGIVECLFPDLYRRLQRRFRADRPM